MTVRFLHFFLLHSRPGWMISILKGWITAMKKLMEVDA